MAGHTTCGGDGQRTRGTITLRDSRFPDPLDVRGRRSSWPHVAVMLLSLAAFLTLFVLRAQDDNRLTSWQWVFGDADVFRITPILAVGLLLAAALARVPFPGRRPRACCLFYPLPWARCRGPSPRSSWMPPGISPRPSMSNSTASAISSREWGGQISAWTDLPLVPLLYGLIFSLAGRGPDFYPGF